MLSNESTSASEISSNDDSTNAGASRGSRLRLRKKASENRAKQAILQSIHGNVDLDETNEFKEIAARSMRLRVKSKNSVTRDSEKLKKKKSCTENVKNETVKNESSENSAQVKQHKSRIKSENVKIDKDCIEDVKIKTDKRVESRLFKSDSEHVESGNISKAKGDKIQENNVLKVKPCVEIKNVVKTIIECVEKKKMLKENLESMDKTEQVFKLPRKQIDVVDNISKDVVIIDDISSGSDAVMNTKSVDKEAKLGNSDNNAENITKNILNDVDDTVDVNKINQAKYDSDMSEEIAKDAKIVTLSKEAIDLTNNVVKCAESKPKECPVNDSASENSVYKDSDSGNSDHNNSASGNCVELETDVVVGATENSDKACVMCGQMITQAEYTNHLSTCMKQFHHSKTSKTEKTTLEEIKCGICNKSMQHMNDGAREQHINRCLDLVEKEKAKQLEEAVAVEKMRSAVLDCPICGKHLKTENSRKSHLKHCAKDNGVTHPQLVELIRVQREEREVLLAAGVVPTVKPKRKDKPTKKPSKRKHPSPADTDLDLAVALSTSIMEEQGRHEAKVSERVPKGRQKKARRGNMVEDVPALLLSTPKSSRTALSDRVSRLVTRPITNAAEASTTPSLGQSKFSDTITIHDHYHDTVAKRQLWSLSHLSPTDHTTRATLYYVTQLMPPIEMSQGIVGRHRRLSAIAGRRKSVDAMKEQNVVSPIKTDNPPPSQTTDILAELAAEGETEATIESQRIEPPSQSIHKYEPDVTQASGFFLESSDHIPCEVTPTPTMMTLSHDLGNALNDPTFSDITIATSDPDLLIHAHKAILAARSPVLRQVLKEGGDVNTIFSPHPHSAVECVLTFIYTGVPSVDTGNVDEVIQLANKLSLHELLSFCERLSKTMSDNNFSSEHSNTNTVFSPTKHDLNPNSNDNCEFLNENDVEEVYEYMMSQKPSENVRKSENCSKDIVLDVEGIMNFEGNFETENVNFGDFNGKCCTDDYEQNIVTGGNKSSAMVFELYDKDNLVTNIVNDENFNGENPLQQGNIIEDMDIEVVVFTTKVDVEKCDKFSDKLKPNVHDIEHKKSESVKSVIEIEDDDDIENVKLELSITPPKSSLKPCEIITDCGISTCLDTKREHIPNISEKLSNLGENEITDEHSNTKETYLTGLISNTEGTSRKNNYSEVTVPIIAITAHTDASKENALNTDASKENASNTDTSKENSANTDNERNCSEIIEIDVSDNSWMIPATPTKEGSTLTEMMSYFSNKSNNTLKQSICKSGRDNNMSESSLSIRGKERGECSINGKNSQGSLSSKMKNCNQSSLSTNCAKNSYHNVISSNEKNSECNSINNEKFESGTNEKSKNMSNINVVKDGTGKNYPCEGGLNFNCKATLEFSSTDVKDLIIPKKLHTKSDVEKIEQLNVPASNIVSHHNIAKEFASSSDKADVKNYTHDKFDKSRNMLDNDLTMYNKGSIIKQYMSTPRQNAINSNKRQSLLFSPVIPNKSPNFTDHCDYDSVKRSKKPDTIEIIEIDDSVDFTAIKPRENIQNSSPENCNFGFKNSKSSENNSKENIGVRDSSIFGEVDFNNSETKTGSNSSDKNSGVPILHQTNNDSDFLPSICSNKDGYLNTKRKRKNTNLHEESREKHPKLDLSPENVTVESGSVSIENDCNTNSVVTGDRLEMDESLVKIREDLTRNIERDIERNINFSNTCIIQNNERENIPTYDDEHKMNFDSEYETNEDKMNLNEQQNVNHYNNSMMCDVTAASLVDMSDYGVINTPNIAASLVPPTEGDSMDHNMGSLVATTDGDVINAVNPNYKNKASLVPQSECGDGISTTNNMARPVDTSYCDGINSASLKHNMASPVDISYRDGMNPAVASLVDTSVCPDVESPLNITEQYDMTVVSPSPQSPGDVWDGFDDCQMEMQPFNEDTSTHQSPLTNSPTLDAHLNKKVIQIDHDIPDDRVVINPNNLPETDNLISHTVDKCHNNVNNPKNKQQICETTKINAPSHTNKRYKFKSRKVNTAHNISADKDGSHSESDGIISNQHSVSNAAKKFVDIDIETEQNVGEVPNMCDVSNSVITAENADVIDKNCAITSEDHDFDDNRILDMGNDIVTNHINDDDDFDDYGGILDMGNITNTVTLDNDDDGILNMQTILGEQTTEDDVFEDDGGVLNMYDNTNINRDPFEPYSLASPEYQKNSLPQPKHIQDTHHTRLNQDKTIHDSQRTRVSQDKTKSKEFEDTKHKHTRTNNTKEKLSNADVQNAEFNHPNVKTRKPACPTTRYSNQPGDPDCTTPRHTNRTNPSTKPWIPPSPFTPMASYNQMSTPRLKGELQKYGVKPLGKKRMVTFLEKLYQETHQYETDSECETSFTSKSKPPATHTNPQPPAIAQPTKTAVTKLANRNAGNKTTTKLPPANTDAPDNTAKKSINENSDSSESEHDVLEESFMPVAEELPSNTQETADVESRLRTFFTTNPLLRDRVLMYEALEFDWLKEEVKRAGVKCTIPRLMKFMDSKCITFTLKNSNDDKPVKNRHVRKVKAASKK